MPNPMNSSLSPPVRTCFATACSLLLALLTPAPAQVVISEIHYHPVEEPAFDGKTNPTEPTNYIPDLDLSKDVHEFIEIQNAGTDAVDLSGWTLGWTLIEASAENPAGAEVSFTFPAGTSIAAGGFKVIAKDPTRIQHLYQITGVLGPFASNLPPDFGGNLSNRGTSVRLKEAAGGTVDAVTYSASFPWAQSANAFGVQDRFTRLNSVDYQYKGRSLQRVSVTGGSSDPANWLASPLTGPTPGTAQAVTRTVPKPVIIAKSHAQTSDGSAVILASQSATITCTFSSLASLSAVQLEWFVDLPNSTTEARTTTAMTELGNGQYRAIIAGQAARSVVRYRITANRGDGTEIVSPRADDPAIAAVGPNNATEPWHGYFVSPLGRVTANPNYDLLISDSNLERIKLYAQANPGRVTAAGASGLPRSVPWVPATDLLWDGTLPAVFASGGVLYDVHVRFHGSRYHRGSNANSLKSFKLHFPENQPFQEQTAWFITSHLQEFDEATRLNRLIGLPASKTRMVSWYFNSEAVVPRLEQGEYAQEMLAEYHRLRFEAQTDPVREPVGELYKNVGNRDKTGEDKEGPYLAGDMAAIFANPSWPKYRRYDWMFSLQNHTWKGPRPMADMHAGMWAARGDSWLNPGLSDANCANAKAWFNANYDMDTTLTAMALVEWMSIWDDAKQNQYFWRRANGKWSRLGWDYDEVMSTSTAVTVGNHTQTIWGGENGATKVFDGINWWKDTFYKCFRAEYKQRLWQLNNSFCDPENLLALGFGTTSKAYPFALLRQACVNAQLGLGPYYKPTRPANASPAAGSAVLGGAALRSSAFAHPNEKAHLATKWEIRTASGNYEEPVYAVTSPTNLASLPIPYGSLAFGQTYYWRVTYIDADDHASVISAETSFTWGIAAAVPGDLKLNEILADNTLIKNGLTAPDYIELHNRGTAAYDLTGLTLTDNLAIPARFTFPAGNTLAAGAHLIVWCDKDTTAPGIHTGFALSADGQTVLLMAGTNVLDSVSFGPQAPDLAIGRATDGTGPWTANLPTPSLPNTPATALGTPATLSINEWMADPAYGDDWFELHNSGSAPVALANLFLSDKPELPTLTKIPALSFIGAGGFTRFLANGSAAGGTSCDFKLSASGESIVLTAANGITNLGIVNFSAQAKDVSQGRFPDGGPLIASFTTTASPERPNWLAAPVTINEILANPATGEQDWVELHNPGTAAVALGGWWLSDDPRSPKKYQIPAGTAIPAGGYLVITAAQFGTGATPFGLSSGGDQACLAASDGSGALTGYRSQASFGSSASGVPFGRIAASGLPNGKADAEFWPLTAATPATLNTAPLTGPVIINEIMYHPGYVGTVDVSVTEFIELYNPTTAAVDLSGWRVKGSSDFTFANGTSLPALGCLLVVGFNPVTDTTALTEFQVRYGLSAGIPMVGPFLPKLANSTHNIELAYPVFIDATLGYVNVDKTEYRDVAPWPTAADGTGADGGGASLQRVARPLIGNTADNWVSSAPTPGTVASSPVDELVITSSSPLPPGTIGTAHTFDFAATGGVPAYSWTMVSGNLPAEFHLATTGKLTGTPTAHGTFSFTVRLTDSLAVTTTRIFELTVAPVQSAFPEPLGWWQFDNPTDHTLATVGASLGTVGIGFTTVPGITGSDGAVRVALGSSYTMNHGIPAGTGGGTKVNEYTLLFDVSYTGNAWKTFFQTNVTNVDDGELFIDNLHRVGGTGIGGFSTQTTAENTWYRVVLTVDNGTARRLYVNGQLWFDGNAGALNDRYALPVILRLFADNDGEDGPIDVTNVAIWSSPFDAAQVAALGVAGAPIRPLTTNPSLVIASYSPLPPATVGTSYSYVFSAAGGTPAYSWAIDSGNLPAEFHLAATGILTGTAATRGTFNFTVRLTDSLATTTTKTFELTVLPAPLVIASASPLPPATAGAPYIHDFSGTGGVPAYSWSITSGSLPAEFQLATTGRLTGAPTVPGSYTFTVRLTDALATTATKTFRLTVAPNLGLSIASASPLPPGTAGASYSYDFAATGGVPAYSWTVESSNLPAEFQLGTTGKLSGTPAAHGTFSFTVRLTDSLAASATKSFELIVNALNPDTNGNDILDTWEIFYFGNADPGNNPAADDADHDGLSNFMEYALNTHPLQATTSPLRYDFATVDGRQYLRLTAPKNPAATNLLYSAEVGATLNGRWSPRIVIEHESTVQIIVRDIESTTSPRRFIRLKVEAMP